MESISGRSIDKSVDQSSSELLAYPSSSEAYLSSDRDVTTQSDTSPYPTRAYR
ncbi:hypothetical protein DPMN_091835 [Dreissena polymorpha]|uniref:Uncharacterized protein n=1 Tax=Dreissena polymorpha TaxID=45954 RepID=A0A9D4QZL3_DREPO|nr:hypothetical protein DPMN_091835 [Dreissena polymorpha]